MKLTIVSRSESDWHVKELLQAAKQNGVTVRCADFDNTIDWAKSDSMFGDVVLWRGSHLDQKSERAVLQEALKGKIVINQSLIDNPFCVYKYYQQNTLSSITSINTIPTYRFRNQEQLKSAINSGKLKIPFIAKPNYGMQGNGVWLIESTSDFDKLENVYDDYIFQPYIENECDWRVIVLGGRVLGIMKRIAQKGSHLNNISQGGTAELETDPKVIGTLNTIALTSASYFDLNFSGVDIIRDKNTGEFYFLEINTAPGWDKPYGFQSITGVNVAQELITYCKQMAQRNDKKTVDLVKEYYDSNFDSLEEKKIHYASRMYLWTHGNNYKGLLKALHKDYLGGNDSDTAKIVERLARVKATEKIQNMGQRKFFFAKYPKLKSYNALLFRSLFAQTLYGQDIRPQVRKVVTDQELVNLYDELINDRDAICVLSTHAINFFYNLNFYFRGNTELAKHTEQDPALFLGLVRTFPSKVNGEDLSLDHQLKLKLYLLTHVIIGATNFYHISIEGIIYELMVEMCEELIRQNYFSITLDNKFEFLVCAALCGKQSYLFDVISQEGEQSFSDVGNFLIDRVNESSDGKVKNKLSSAEHRNVLYLMSQIEFVKASNNRIVMEVPTDIDKTVIGRKALIDIPKFGISSLSARVDTGADYSSLHARNITLKTGNSGKELLWFDTFAGGVGNTKTVRVHTSNFETVRIRNTGGALEQRYVVRLAITVQGRKLTTMFSLSDRSQMVYPVLLGRKALKGNFLVDVSKLVVQNNNA